MAPLVDRMIRAGKLDVRLYEEVEADTTATGQALLVVVLASLAAGIGAVGAGITAAIVGVFAAIISWGIGAAIIYFIGAKVFPESQTNADWGQLLRTLGFANAPGVLLVLAFIPILGGFLALAVAVWLLVAAVIAVRQALDYQSTWRAVGVCLAGWIVMGIGRAIAFILFAPGQALT